MSSNNLLSIAKALPPKINAETEAIKMVDGRMNKFFQENCLLQQSYIKDPDKKVIDLITESIATLGENIAISRYVRFAVGESVDSN